MGGGVLQLAAYGGQDIETMGNPQMTFFKSVYKKHTNFSIEIIEQSFNGNITKEESRVDSTISKSGDLIHGCHLDIKFPEFPVGSGSSYNNWVNSTGYAYVKEVSLSIGELQIDKHYSDQIKELEDSKKEPEILETIKQFHADELEHEEIAKNEISENTPALKAFKKIVKVGCRAAISLSEKI